MVRANYSKVYIACCQSANIVMGRTLASREAPVDQLHLAVIFRRQCGVTRAESWLDSCLAQWMNFTNLDRMLVKRFRVVISQDADFLNSDFHGEVTNGSAIGLVQWKRSGNCTLNVRTNITECPVELKGVHIKLLFEVKGDTGIIPMVHSIGTRGSFIGASVVLAIKEGINNSGHFYKLQIVSISATKPEVKTSFVGIPSLSDDILAAFHVEIQNGLIELLQKELIRNYLKKVNSCDDTHGDEDLREKVN